MKKREDFDITFKEVQEIDGTGGVTVIGYAVCVVPRLPKFLRWLIDPEDYYLTSSRHHSSNYKEPDPRFISFSCLQYAHVFETVEGASEAVTSYFLHQKQRKSISV